MAFTKSIYEASRTPVHFGVGTNVSGAKTSKEVIDLAGLNWNVNQEAITTQSGIIIPDTFANVRSDNQEVLGIVNKRYKPVQNAEAFSFVDNLLGEGVTFETAGLTRTNRVWMLARMDSADYKVADDEAVPFLLFCNSHDGKHSVRVCCTVVRCICNNTINYALKTAKRCWSVTHSGNIAGKMEEARETLNLTGKYLANLAEEADVQTQIVIAPTFINDLAKVLFPINEKQSNIVNLRAEENQNTLVGIYNNMSDIKKYQNTMWGVNLALTDMASHLTPNRTTDSFNENRFISAFEGTDLATKGMELAMQMA